MPGFEIEDTAIEEILGRSDRRFLFLLSEAVLARDAGRCLKIIDEAYYAGLDMKFFYQTLLGHFRNLLLIGISGDRRRGGFPRRSPRRTRREKYRAQTAGASRETLQRYLEILMAEEENVRRSQNPRLNLEAILCRMAWLEPMIPIDEVLSRMEGLERRLGGEAGGGNAPARKAGAARRAGVPRRTAGCRTNPAASDARATKNGPYAAGAGGSSPAPAAVIPAGERDGARRTGCRGTRGVRDGRRRGAARRVGGIQGLRQAA